MLDMTVLLVTCPLKRGRGHSSERVKLIEEVREGRP